MRAAPFKAVLCSCVVREESWWKTAVGFCGAGVMGLDRRLDLRTGFRRRILVSCETFVFGVTFLR